MELTPEQNIMFLTTIVVVVILDRLFIGGYEEVKDLFRDAMFFPIMVGLVVISLIAIMIDLDSFNETFKIVFFVLSYIAMWVFISITSK